MMGADAGERDRLLVFVAVLNEGIGLEGAIISMEMLDGSHSFTVFPFEGFL
jgi:hypothetical protein